MLRNLSNGSQGRHGEGNANSSGPPGIETDGLNSPTVGQRSPQGEFDETCNAVPTESTQLQTQHSSPLLTIGIELQRFRSAVHMFMAAKKVPSRCRGTPVGWVLQSTDPVMLVEAGRWAAKRKGAGYTSLPLLCFPLPASQSSMKQRSQSGFPCYLFVIRAIGDHEREF